MTRLPYQQEGECGGTHGKIAEHLQKNGSISFLKDLAEKIKRIRHRPLWQSGCCCSEIPSKPQPEGRSKAGPSSRAEEQHGPPGWCLV